MATKKPKSGVKNNKTAKSNKSKSAAEEPVSVKTTAQEELEVVETAKTDKPEKTDKVEKSEKVEQSEKSEKIEKSEKTEKAEKTDRIDTVKAEKSSISSTPASGSIFKGFFAKKYEAKESILTIFKSHKFYGSLFGEAIGSMLITLLLFGLSLMGIASMATYSFAVLAIFIAVYAFSGACINPLVTVGMMASRRMSVIRGIMYIIAEIVGAWLGWLIFNSFHLAGGDSAYAIPTMAEIADGKFWIIAMVELLGAAIIAFFYARALKYKRSVFTFGAIIAGGTALAIVICYVVSAAFFSMNSNFILNPAAALMFQIFPTSGEDFGAIFGGIMQALAAYALIPMIGGTIGFCLSDFTAKLSEEE